MPLFQVTKGQDAYVNYTTIIEASSAEEAFELASGRDFRNGDHWILDGVTNEYDHADVFEDRVVPFSGESLEEAMEALKRQFAPIKTYLVSYTDLNGDSRDLIVEATTPGGAFELWGDYYHEDEWINHRHDCLEDEGLDGILVEGNSCGDDDLRIFELSAGTGLPRALKWNTDDLKVVAWVGQS